MEVTAITTETDRKRTSVQMNISDSKRCESASRLRQRIGEYKKDTEILEKHHLKLYREPREAVCDE